MLDFADARRRMVDNQLRTFDVSDRAVLAAMDAVPREAFLPEALRSLAYLDRHQRPAGPDGAVVLSPMIFARLVQAAGVRPTEVVLDVGCAGGFSSAVLSRLGAYVVAVESDAALAASAREALAGADAGNVNVVTGDLAAGCAAEAPYDVIVVNGGFEVAPAGLLAQLRDGGRLVGIDVAGRSGKAVVYVRSGDVISRREVFEASAPVLAAFRRAPEFVL